MALTEVICCLAVFSGGLAWAGTEFPVSEERGRASGTLCIPTGAGEFEIERPRARSGPVLKASDFGFSATNDLNGAAICRALKAAGRLRARRLELAPGTYNCFDSEGIVAQDLKDFELDGRGALLVFRRSGGGANLKVVRTDHCVVRNLKMDWDWRTDPLATIGTCVAVHVDETKDNASYFDMRVDAPHPDYPKPVKLQTMTTVDGARRHLVGDQPNRLVFLGLESGPKNEWISPDTLRIWPGVRPQADDQVVECHRHYYTPKVNRETVRKIPVGISYRMLHYYYGLGAIALEGNAHLTVEDVDVWSCRGFGMEVDGDQHHWQVRNFRLAPPPDLISSRLTSSTADGHHVARSGGWCKYENFTVEYCNDDSHNFHDRTAYGVAESPDRLRVTTPQGIAYFAPRVGDEIELREVNFDSAGWRGRIVRIEGETMSMDRPVPRPKGDRFLFFNRSFGTDHLIFRNCTCRDSHLRNLFQTRDVTIENCTFERMGQGLWFAGAWTLDLWCEGTGVSNYVIRDCVFRNGCQQRRTDLFGLAPEITTLLRIPPEVAAAKPTPGFYSDILIENCRFENLAGAVLDIRHAKNFIFRGNEILDDGRLVPRRPCRNGLNFGNCDGVTVVGNRWRLARGLPVATVSLSDGDVRSFVQTGNTVESEDAPVLDGSDEDPSRWVDPFVGCSYNGHCFAAACVPFGMVQAGPDTGFLWWDYCSGYRYADTNILGFSQTHISGTGCGDLGDLLLMPFAGAADLTRTNFASAYRKETQVAEPG